MTSRKIIVTVGNLLPHSEDSFHLAFYITPAEGDQSFHDVDPLVLRSFSLSGGKNEQHEFSWSPSLRFLHWLPSTSEPLSITEETASDAVEPNQYFKLRPDLKWESHPLPDSPEHQSLVFNDSGRKRHFAFGHRCGEVLKPCAFLGPLDHRHGIYTTTNFILQACVVTEHYEDGQRLDKASLEDRVDIIKPVVELSTLDEDVHLWLHVSDNGHFALTYHPLTEDEDEDEVGTVNDMLSEPSLIHPEDTDVTGGFVQTVEFYEKPINIEQVKRIVMQSLRRANAA